MVVGYCRISRDDNKQNYASIEEQKSIIFHHAVSKGLIVTQYYIDDNYSGYKVDEKDDTLFDRPAFQQMWEEVKQGKIDTILIKDLSRLGRNNPVVLIVLERLKKLSCKLLLCDENRDVISQQDDTIPIRTWFNEMYVKDISRKVRANMLNKQREGRLIMGNFYGYSKKDKTNLIADETLKSCIELIYRLYIEGNGYIKICDYLNTHTDFPTPSCYYAEKHREKGRTYGHKVAYKWEAYMVKNILSNDVYCGILRTHKKQTKTIRGTVQKLPEQEHFIFENHHEAIIAKEEWELVQEIRKRRGANAYKGSTKNDYYFKGFTVCGECGYHAGGVILKRKVNVPAYNCSQFTRYGKKGCGNKETREEDLINHFKAFLLDTRKTYKEYLSSVDFTPKGKADKTLVSRLQKELEKAGQELKVLIALKIKEVIRQPEEFRQITVETYNKLEGRKKQRILDVREQIEGLEKQNDIGIEHIVQNAVDVMDEIIASDRPDRKLLEMILDKIVFHRDRTIEFKLKVDIKDICMDIPG